MLHNTKNLQSIRTVKLHIKIKQIDNFQICINKKKMPTIYLQSVASNKTFITNTS